jgi:hypothetical protein
MPPETERAERAERRKPPFPKKETAPEGRLRRLLVMAVFLAEPFDTPCGIHQLLLAGKEGVAAGTDFGENVALFG